MITVEFKAEQLMAALTRADAQFDDMLPLYRQIGEILLTSTKERFAKGEAPDGTKWKPKSPATLAKYGARKSNNVDSRPLYGPTKLLSQQITSDAASDQVEIGSNRVYAAMMQYGGTKAAFPHLWGDIPARPFLGISAQDETNLVGEIEEWLRTAIRPG